MNLCTCAVVMVVVLLVDGAISKPEVGRKLLLGGGGDGNNATEVHDIPGVMQRMGLPLQDPVAERAFFAQDFGQVAYSDFRALWARCERAKEDEANLVAAGASEHAIVCNKLLKVGAEAVMYAIFNDGASAQEHLLKFRKNLPLAGSTCTDAGLGR